MLFYSPVQQLPSVTTNPYPSYGNTYQPYSSNVPVSVDNEIDSARALHLGITITSIFVPFLIYLIGFPFCYVKLRDLTDRSNHPNIHELLRSYMGVGWFTWILHFACFIVSTVSWIPQCWYAYETSDNGYYYHFYQCSSISGLISIWTIVPLTVIFTIVTTSLGAVLVNKLAESKNPYQTF